MAGEPIADIAMTRWSLIGTTRHLTFSMSGSTQLLSNRGFSGP